MRPSSVVAPVAVTSVTPLPTRTSEPANSSFARWDKASVAAEITSVFFSTASDSPVSCDSSTVHCPEIRRTSAGTRSPDSSRTVSPGISSLAGSCTSCPSRRTLASGALNDCSDAISRSARKSISKPTATLRVSATKIASASPSSPIASESTAVPKRISTMKLLTCRSSSAQIEGGGVCGSWFGP